MRRTHTRKFMAIAEVTGPPDSIHADRNPGVRSPMLEPTGRSRTVSRPRKPRSVSTITRSAATTPGTSTPTWRCRPHLPRCHRRYRPKSVGSGNISLILGEIRCLLAHLITHRPDRAAIWRWSTWCRRHQYRAEQAPLPATIPTTSRSADRERAEAGCDSQILRHLGSSL